MAYFSYSHIFNQNGKEKKKGVSGGVGLGFGEGLRKKENQCALYLLVVANSSGCHLLV